MADSDQNLDPYKALGIAPSADDRLIKQAYRRLAKDCHPDLNQNDPGRTRQFRAITDAYELLSDKSRRATYDAEMAMAYARPEPQSAAAARREPGAKASATRMAGHPHARRSSSTNVARALGLCAVVLGSIAVLALSHSSTLLVAPKHSPSLLSRIIAGEAGPENGPGANEMVVASVAETLPSIPKEMLSPSPPPGLLVPDRSRLRFGFSNAAETHLYYGTGYKTIYRQGVGEGAETLAFSEAAARPFEPVQPEDADARAFTFMGGPGYLTYRLLQNGTIDGHLHWSDHGRDLAIHAAGIGGQLFTEHDLMDLLAMVKRVPSLAAETPRPVAAQPPAVHSDPCGPGTVCYDRRLFGRRGWFIQRGHGNEHPS